MLLGCVDLDPGEAPLPRGDPQRFALEIQPLLGARCADVGCHGNPTRPFSVYAPRRYRLDPAATFLDQPLTSEELRRNLIQTTAQLAGLDRAETSALLRKPLAPATGGSDHVGGSQFLDPSDAEYQQLRLWAQSCLPAEPVQ